MIYVTEAQSAAIITHEMAFDAARAAFIAVVAPEARIFPVVLGHGTDPQNRFTIKSAVDARLVGFKVGTYFPTNDLKGIPRHDSAIFLLDQAIGRIGAIVEGGKLNAFRTAAADPWPAMRWHGRTLQRLRSLAPDIRRPTMSLRWRESGV